VRAGRSCPIVGPENAGVSPSCRTALPPSSHDGLDCSVKLNCSKCSASSKWMDTCWASRRCDEVASRYLKPARVYVSVHHHSRSRGYLPLLVGVGGSLAATSNSGKVTPSTIVCLQSHTSFHCVSLEATYPFHLNLRAHTQDEDHETLHLPHQGHDGNGA